MPDNTYGSARFRREVLTQKSQREHWHPGVWGTFGAGGHGALTEAEAGIYISKLISHDRPGGLRCRGLVSVEFSEGRHVTFYWSSWITEEERAECPAGRDNVHYFRRQEVESFCRIYPAGLLVTGHRWNVSRGLIVHGAQDREFEAWQHSKARQQGTTFYEWSRA